jgi:hypothetical protein
MFEQSLFPLAAQVRPAGVAHEPILSIQLSIEPGFLSFGWFRDPADCAIYPWFLGLFVGFPLPAEPPDKREVDGSNPSGPIL